VTGGPARAVRREARIDLSALASNLDSALAADGYVVLDARADAYGHGLDRVARIALERGVTTIRVSPAQSAIPGVRRSAIMTVASKGRPLVGAAAYGLDGVGRAVMTLVGEVIAVKAAPADAGVSYGYSYRTTDATTLALVALGYADGVPRLASNRAQVLVGGALHPLVGRVAMDQFVVDCGTSSPQVGDEAVLFGVGAAPATEWAVHTGRAALELTAGIGSRVTRVYS